MRTPKQRAEIAVAAFRNMLPSDALECLIGCVETAIESAVAEATGITDAPALRVERHGRHHKIICEGSKPSRSVDVFQWDNMDDSPSLPFINLEGFGTKDVALIRQYATALLEAARIAGQEKPCEES